MTFEVIRIQTGNEEGAPMEYAVGIMADENYNPISFVRIVARHGNNWNAADSECERRNMMFVTENVN